MNNWNQCEVEGLRNYYEHHETNFFKLNLLRVKFILIISRMHNKPEGNFGIKTTNSPTFNYFFALPEER